MIKSFISFLCESEPIKPIENSQRIPKKLPPKSGIKPKKPKNSNILDKIGSNRVPDSFIKSPNLGFKPYSGKKQ